LNAGLLVFAFLLIIAGAYTGSLFILFFGVIFLIAGILPSRRRVGIPSGQTPRPAPPRAPPPKKEAERPHELPVPIPKIRIEPSSVGLANAPLFLSPVFPTLSPLPQVKFESPPEAKKGEAPDEFLTLVVLVGLMRLFSRER